MQLRNRAEGGTNATTVSTANSGGTSGDPFTTVSIGGAGTFTFDATRAYKGALSYKVVSDGAAVLGTWTLPTPAKVPRLWGRLYFYATALPAANVGLVQLREGGAQGFRLTLNSSGQLEARNAANAVVATVAAAVALNQWVRIELRAHGDATAGEAEIRLYNNPEAITPTASASATGVAMREQWDEIRVGNVGAAYTHWIDNASFSDQGWIGQGDFPFDVRVGGEAVRVTGAEPARWDFFTRSGASTWGTATSGHAWALARGVAGSFSLNGSGGVITLPDGSTTPQGQVFAGSAGNWTNVDVHAKFAVSALATGDSMFPAVVFRNTHPDVNLWYRVRVILATTGAVGLDIQAVSTTLTGDTATQTAAGLPTNASYMITPDADAADIAVGSVCKIYNAAGALKEETLVYVTSKASAFGFTEIHFEPDAAEIFEAGDQLREVTPTGSVIQTVSDVRDTYAAGNELRIRARIINQTIQARVWNVANNPIEPGIWQAAATVTANTIPYGGVGLAFSRVGGNTNTGLACTFDDFEITNPQRFTVVRAINSPAAAHAAGEPVALARPAKAAR